jgi:hypothetical protein
LGHMRRVQAPVEKRVLAGKLGYYSFYTTTS